MKIVTRERWRGAVALTAAVLLHLAMHGLAGRLGSHATKTIPAPPAAAAQEIELEPAIEPVSPALPAPSVAEPDAPPTAAVAALRGRSSEATGAPSPETTETPGGGEAAPAPAAPSASSGWSFDPTKPNIMPGAVAFAHAAEAPAAATAAPASTTGGIIEALDAADVARGMGRGGPVRTAVDLAARTGDGPVRGSATFAITIFDDGRVDVQVASNHTDWAKIIPEIREAVRKAQIKLPPKSRGLSVVVAVESKVKYPDGYEPPPEKTTVDTKLALDAQKPWVDVAVRGKRCSARVAIMAGGLSGGADCAVGTAARIVSTRIVKEERL